MAMTATLDLSSLTNEDLTILYTSIEQVLSLTPYTPPDSNPNSIKDLLLAFLRPQTSTNFLRKQIINFCRCCSALAYAEGQDSPSLYWIPKELSVAARFAVRELARLVLVEESVFVEGIKETCVIRGLGSKPSKIPRLNPSISSFSVSSVYRYL